MYLEHYGLREPPFSLLPDPAFLFLSRKHSMALSVLEYSLTGNAGFVVITGEVGSGKTTLLRRFLRSVDDNAVVGLISNTHSAFGELLDWILAAFNVAGPASDGEGKPARYRRLTDFLIARYAERRPVVLIVDEAQNMAPQVLEELRLLSNLNSEKDLLLQIILVGQPELLENLKRPELRQFSQRISVNYHLSPLEYLETRGYIRHRIRIAGGSPRLFSEQAMAAAHLLTAGVPRLINSVCDMALVYGYAEDKTEIDLETVVQVVRHKLRQGLGGLPEAAETNLDAIHLKCTDLERQLTPEVLELDVSGQLQEVAATYRPLRP